MPLLRIVLTVCLLLALGCKGADIPPDKTAYIGQWRGNDMLFELSQSGMVNYKRHRGGASTSINLPLQKFEGNNLTVGIGPAGTTFSVSAPPHQDEGKWKMTLDGVELCRDK